MDGRPSWPPFLFEGCPWFDIGRAMNADEPRTGWEDSDENHARLYCGSRRNADVLHNRERGAHRQGALCNGLPQCHAAFDGGKRLGLPVHHGSTQNR